MARFAVSMAFIIPLVVVFFVVSNNKAKKNKEKPTASAKTDADTASKAEKKFAIEITEDNFEELTQNTQKPVVLDFWASWCGPCMMLGPHIEEIAKEYEGVAVVGKVNVDEQQELGIKFQAAQIPLVVVLHKGEIVARIDGFEPGKTPDEIRQQISELTEK